MKKFEEKIWNEGEYTYKAAYGFVPNIHAYLHDDDEKRDCMIVLPGGGYCMCVPPEANIPAMEFYSRGMNVFVLTYTTDITFSVPLKKQPLFDAARAVRFIRKRDKEYNIDGKKIILCGFSAGAHVSGSLAVHFDDVPDENADYREISARPDGVILSYPVITTGEYTHIYSVWALLGKDASQDELDYFSLEKQVKENTPPCFIWQTANDNLVPVENSYLMANALKEKGVMYAHYVFPDGFHGLSVPNEDFFAGKFEDFTMDQVMRAVAAVKKGESIDVSEERIKELKEQFSDDKKEEAPPLPPNPVSLFKDVATWPDLAMVWMNRI
ncbi:MAG: alpha/beta hydrolase [Lachnospiraceae bacterium]|nr:alpha/beta hydrolase [Lachnospiraceae bacterium]